MAVLNILRYPDARLHKVAAPVTVFDETLKKLVADMAETMYAAPGIGLAATQADIHKQVIVVDVSERRDSLVVLVNPEIVEAVGVSDIEAGQAAAQDSLIAPSCASSLPARPSLPNGRWRGSWPQGTRLFSH